MPGQIKNLKLRVNACVNGAGMVIGTDCLGGRQNGSYSLGLHGNCLCVPLQIKGTETAYLWVKEGKMTSHVLQGRAFR